MIDISIILVNYKNKEFTENCINSILKLECDLRYEIIVVDNNSKDDSIEYLQNKFPNITIFDSGKNLGFAFGNNMGVKVSHGKYLLFLNNDTIIFDNILEDLYTVSEENPKIGLLGCRAIDRNGIELPISHKYENLKTSRMQTYIKPIFEKLKIQRYLVSITKKFFLKNKEIVYADWIAGSMMFVKRKFYDDIGGLDEKFFMYMEDEDLSHRVNDRGYLVGVINKIGYIHYCGGSTIQSYFLTKEYFKSRLLYFKRYNNREFFKIKKSLYKQIKVINGKLTKQQINSLKEELELYVYEIKNEDCKDIS